MGMRASAAAATTAKAENRVPAYRGPGSQNPLLRRGLYAPTIAFQAVWSNPTPEQVLQIEANTSPARLHRYRAVVGGHRIRAVQLYLADAGLASHFHAHLRMMEVILREQLHRSLANAYGQRWYISHAGLLGGNGPAMLTNAQFALGRAKWQNPGYVVAELMLGFWSGLLQTPAGGHHRQLWTDALDAAAFNTRTGLSPWSQHDAMLVCKRLNWARNRVNHCESVVFGFPQKGMVQGKQLRLPPQMILEDCRRVVSRFNSDLEDWMSASSTADGLLAEPAVHQAWLHICADPGIVLPAQVPAHLWQVP